MGRVAGKIRKNVYKGAYPCYNRVVNIQRALLYGTKRALNMLCSTCNEREGTHRVGKEGEQELWLCEECFALLGDAANHAGESPDFFVSFLQPKKSVGKECPVCGTTLKDYARTGLVGCAACYDTFREELIPAIRRIHGKTTHKGKRPLGSGSSFELLNEQKRLRAELECAVREKRLKDAEKLNHDIRVISDLIYRGKGEEDGQ